MPQFYYPPSFELRALVTRLPRPLGELKAPPIEPPIEPPVATWQAVTDLLYRFGRRRSHARRPGGERVGLAARAGRLRPVNAAVDAAVVTALRSGLPLAVVDHDRLRGPLRVAAIAKPTRLAVDDRGGTLEVGGLPALFDADGPQATPVGIAGAVAPTAATTTTLTLLWGSAALGLDAAIADLAARMTALGGACEPLALPGPADDPAGRALLARVHADPNDDAARRAFADWLDVHGGAPGRRRARYIRETLVGFPDYRSEREVFADAELADWPLGWRRGFVFRVGLAESFNPPLLPRLADEPVEEVDIHGVDPAGPLPPTTRQLRVHNPNGRRAPHPAPARLRVLFASVDVDDADTWRWIAGLPALERLAMHVGDQIFYRLTSASPALRALNLMGGRFTPDALAALPVAQLVELELHTHPLDDALLRALPPTPALEKLQISKVPITTLAPFAAASPRYLSLWQVPLAAPEVARILAMERLEILHISECPAIERPIAEAIERGALPALRGLYGLHVRHRDLEHGGRRRRHHG